MTLLFADGFDHYSTSTIAYKWDTTNQYGIITAVASGGSAWSNTTGSFDIQALVSKKSLGNNTTLYCGFRIYMGGWSSSAYNDGYIFSLVDTDLTPHISLYQQTTTVWDIYRGTSNVTTGNYKPPNSRWLVVELYVNCHDTTGAYTLNIDGTTIYTASNVDTRNGSNGYLSKICINNYGGQTGSGYGVANAYYIDDLYVSDSGFLDNPKIYTLYPSGNGNSSGFTGSDGNSTDNYALVDEAAISSTDYVQAASSSLKDTYAFGNLTVTPATIYGVQTCLSGSLDSGTRDISPVIRSGGSDYNGTTVSPSTAVYTYTEMFENDPATATAWTESGVNNAEFGIRSV